MGKIIKEIEFDFMGEKLECIPQGRKFLLSNGINFSNPIRKIFFCLKETNIEEKIKKIINSNIKSIQDFMENYDFKEINIDIYPKKKDLIYFKRIDFEEDTISFIFSIDSENWNKLFTIKKFKNFLKKEGIILSTSNFILEIPINSIETSLTLKELQEKSTIFLNEKLQDFEQENLPEKKLEFKVHEKFKTGIKQYIVYFNEYVERTKGISIDFEVENYSEGLILKLNKNQNIEKIGEYFEEYMNFLRYEKIEDIQPIYEIERTEHDKKEDIMILHGEINDLRHKYERSQLLLNEKERYALKCQEEVSNYKCFIEWLMQQNTQISNLLQMPSSSSNPNIALTFNNTNTSASTNTNINTINISQQIENLQKDIEKIKDFFKELEIKDKEEELEEIDDEILEVSSPEDLKSKKKMFNKFKRIINHINDENSTLNATIKAAKKGKECLEKIKPYIPTILTTLNNLTEYFK